jgi:hypothetical protein
MILFLFLVSVATLEAILYFDKPRIVQPPRQKDSGEEQTRAGLQALSRALGSATRPEVHETEAEPVQKRSLN